MFYVLVGFAVDKRCCNAQVYDLSLDAALRAQACGPRQLTVEGEWAWLLGAFAGTYGVRPSYAVLAHLRWVVRCAACMHTWKFRLAHAVS